MADYLYSITLQNQHQHDVVRLDQLTEQAGLDLVTFMDHPCNRGSSTPGRCYPTWQPRQGECGCQDMFSARLSVRPGTPSSGSGELGPSVLWPLRTRHWWSNRYQRLGCNRGHGRGGAHASGVRESA